MCVCVVNDHFPELSCLFREFSSCKHWYQWYSFIWIFYNFFSFSIILAKIPTSQNSNKLFTSSICDFYRNASETEREKEREPSKYLRICVSVCICMYVYSHICMKCWRNYFFLVSLNTLSTMDVELNWALLEGIFWYNHFIFIICIYYVNRFLAKPS